MTAASIPVHVVRVFTTDDGRLGNELGLVESEGATRGHEQEIAARLGFSETVFLDEVGTGAARIRIFTPAAELPFAGHPTVGTAWWLRQRGTPVEVLRVPAGDVAVRFDGDVAWVTGRASWTPEFEWHDLASAVDVEALEPADFTSGHHYAWAWMDEGRGILRSRMFAPAFGIAEDEATGAAAVRLTDRLGRDLDIEQGRGSRIRTRVLDGGFIEVGGRVAQEPGPVFVAL
ncbi:PhzF family phenazine biosynthesis protein [Frondihabitans sp. 762G35]|uniref:PhzF family phenazine biosynthesis protein n=1 Tax=Frondihabitans sp. 762G35 TaxID=1446794 RepID=UPI000E706DE6|nr:PhzF family phenazine biosynthesis protein [Frondihabitans sp. 762G35]